MALQSTVVPVRGIRLGYERFALAGLAALLLFLALAFVGYRLTTPSDGTVVAGTGNPFAAGGLTIVPDRGFAGSSPFRPGDRVASIAGRPVEAWAKAVVDPTVARPALVRGEALDVIVRRDGRSIDLAVPLADTDPLPGLFEEAGVLAFALAMQLAGAYLFVRRPGEPASRALLIGGTGMFASSIPWAIGLQASDLVGGVGFWLYAAATGFAYALFWSGALHLAMVFPRPLPFASSRRRIVAIAYVIPIGAQLALIAGAVLSTGRALAGLEAWILSQAILQLAVIALTLAMVGYSYWRLLDPVGRQQVRWVAAAIALVGVGSLLLWFGPEAAIGEPLLPRSAVALLGLPFPLALGMAIARYRLFDLDVLVNRSLVYGGLTAGILVAYGATVLVVSRLIPSDASFASTLLGVGVVALVALPLRDRLQRIVDRLTYGDRADPYRAVRRLGERMERAPEQSTVLPMLVETVAESLRLPYVAIELDRDGLEVARSSTGTPPTAARMTDLIRLPIVYRGQRIGGLILAPRGPGERFGEADQRLLTDLVRQAAPAAEAVRLAADVQRSREQLVTTREEERRRLRRDLHDGLGPTLAGTLMKLEAARAMLADDPARSGRLVEETGAELRRTIDEVRRLAYGLRPPALDEFGLAGALRRAAADFSVGRAADPLVIDLQAAEDLPELPAAVEVAAFRIALEALTNVVRHSGAERASVELALADGSLVVRVTDDGQGMDGGDHSGVGLTSMRERAEELGGGLDIEPVAGGGTRVTARLPVVVVGGDLTRPADGGSAR